MNMRGYSAARIAELEREVADLRVDREMRKVAEDELADISKLFPVSEESGVLEAVQSVVADNATLSRQLAEARAERQKFEDNWNVTVGQLQKSREIVADYRAQLAASEKDKAALNEAARAIEEAPHGFDCSYFRNSCRENDGTITRGNCNCWKRAALDRINELLTNP